ncbi:MAG: 2,3-cyclic 3-phosphodiesterase [Frankiaceae bacterium]|nr:2,3-cyclic 3-phosphodiesterase [Frankiaceae bacterium]
MRAFVAVVPPPPALASLVAAVEPLRAAYPAGVTWVPAERLHLTLAFLGEVTDPVAAALGDGLRLAVARIAPFDVRVAGGGAFPRPERPKVLWAGVAGDVDALDRLARVTRGAARDAGVRLERAPYVPHVTVARIRTAPLDGPAAVAALRRVEGEPWTVTEAVLVRSVPGPHPSYEPLARCALGYQA